MKSYSDFHKNNKNVIRFSHYKCEIKIIHLLNHSNIGLLNITTPNRAYILFVQNSNYCLVCQSASSLGQ